MTNFERITKSPEVLAKHVTHNVVSAFNTVLEAYGQFELNDFQKEKLMNTYLDWLNKEAETTNEERETE